MHLKIIALKKQRALRFFCGLALFGTLLYFLVPKPDLYNQYSFSSAIYDRSGHLLKLSLSLDDKYRLYTPLTEIPHEAQQALLLYEDKHFYSHFGVNPVSFIRALAEMAKGGRRQGASTISMQVARIVYHIDSTKLAGKIEQILRALQIELFYSKKQILEVYFNIAPYGGNIEGIGAASLIYFKTKVSKLNLPQIMALTVIPQNPTKRSLLQPTTKQNNLIAANRLKKIWRKTYRHQQNDYLDLPLESYIYLPNFAPHFTRRILQNHNGNLQSTLDLSLQEKIRLTLQKYVEEQHKNGVHNATALLLDNQDLSVLAYVGSADFYNTSIFGQVDGIQAKRSPGSALKPFIYALALQKGIIHPLSMLKDVPRKYGAYAPENFDYTYFGLIDATHALTLSRNIPAVDLLLQIGEQNFYDLLQKCGVTFTKSADYYGLSMALGGVEVSVENLAGMYAMLANNGNFGKLRFLTTEPINSEQNILPEAAFLTNYMLTRSENDNSQKIPFAKQNSELKTAWKTGTSYGYKDAWTAGNFGKYTLVVWFGNFDGTPNPAFIGKNLAAPLFFRIAWQISAPPKKANSLYIPDNFNLAKVKICRDTGDLATAFCTKQAETFFIPGVTSIKMSNVNRLIPIDIKTGLRACRHTPPATILKPYNFWPSDVLAAFKSAGVNLKLPPAFKESCTAIEDFKQGFAPQILSPSDNSTFLIKHPNKDKIPLKASLDAETDTVYWFVNNKFSGSSKAEETFTIAPVYGKNQIKAVDNMGRQSTISVTMRPTD